MPLYDFRCEKCRHVFEANLSLKEKEEGVKPHCSNCDSTDVKQIFTTFGYVRKQVNNSNCGSGFG